MSGQEPPKPKTHILTIDGAKDFHEDYGDKGLNGYQIATEEMCIRLNAIMQNTSGFEELKKELTEFLKDRKEFSTFLLFRSDENTGKYSL
jgi:hypothetical protein